MPDKTTIRKFIRHPADVPIQVTLDWAGDDDHDDADQTITNVSLGGLAFISQEPLELLQRVRIAIPVLDQDNFLVGNVVWCDKADGAYEIGVEFEHGRDAYRLRMIEQICHIEHYRNEVARTEGRELSSQDAAREWIARFAGDFPSL
ncbi:MAG: PilZ domain-containing protein [Gammaproteobacteria bacterium]|nr:PilZ domain-containing protein [Gammaproteobacteria bacterium]